MLLQYRRKTIGAEEFQLDVGVEGVAFQDFRQNSKSKLRAVNAASDMKFGVAIDKTVGRLRCSAQYCK